MIESAGFVIIKNNKILLCHPTKAKWDKTFSIPKGQVEKGEDLVESAIRETYEEVGLLFEQKDIDKTQYVIDYVNKAGRMYKRVFYFIVNEMKDIPDVIPKDQLQLSEIDWAGFMDYETAKEKIFWRFEPILDLIKK